MKKLIVFFVLAAVALVACGAGYLYYSCKIAEPKWVKKTATVGPIRKIVSATGSLSPVNTVQVGCQISGIVASVAVDFNDEVKTGQLLAIIDPTAYEAELNQTIANLEGAISSEKTIQARLAGLQADLSANDAEAEIQSSQLKKAEITVESAKRTFHRMEEIFKKKMIPKADVDDAQSALKSSDASLSAAKAQIKLVAARRVSAHTQIVGLKAELEGAAARIRQMTAQKKVAQTNLNRTNIFSPIDGVVISRNVSMGQTVAAGFQAPTLFTIAQDLGKMQIEALVDESDVCKIQPGQIATFSVDPFPNLNFSGVVKQVRISPNTESKIMYPVILAVENPDKVLKPGLTAKIEILVESREDVTRIPTESLFFVPPPEILKRFPVPEEEPEKATETMRIWLLEDGKIAPVEVITGISNAKFTEILSGNVASGASVITYTHKWWMDLFGRH